ncbi:MAG: metallophosphoesterase family protein [Prevotellaceae bacterium]|jgi:3',5'-cyclic AMP phosphodiesterase CpdA|nr:metallophosphoesterase family protein [Prevotellaceae bacterium]
MKKIIFILTLSVLTVGVSAQTTGENEQTVKLKYNAEGKFKIVQFTDIHYNIASENSPVKIETLNRVIEAEKPDIVVFTGDIITCRPQQQGWEEVLGTVVKRNIPYVVTMGNHDQEHDWTREQIAEYLEKQPGSLFLRGPKNIKGVGNFVAELEGDNGKTANLIYFMDSNAYGLVGENMGWDWFAFNQVDWYRATSRRFTEKNEGKPLPALAFFHIPLQEYRALFDTVNINYFKLLKPMPVYGERGERECFGIINTGMFAAMVEAGDVMGTFVGHDHFNNYIGCLDGICLAYGLCSGEKGLRGGGRVIELSENSRGFDTWIRRGDGEVAFKVNYPESFKR